jgi:hypothetical protein
MFNAVVKNLILNGTKTIGKDASGVLGFVEENLTPAEYPKVKAFLEWSFKKNKPFGWGNFDDRVKEFEKTYRGK